MNTHHTLIRTLLLKAGTSLNRDATTDAVIPADSDDLGSTVGAEIESAKVVYLPSLGRCATGVLEPGSDHVSKDDVLEIDVFLVVDITALTVGANDEVSFDIVHDYMQDGNFADADGVASEIYAIAVAKLKDWHTSNMEEDLISINETPRPQILPDDTVEFIGRWSLSGSYDSWTGEYDSDCQFLGEAVLVPAEELAALRAAKDLKP